MPSTRPLQVNAAVMTLISLGHTVAAKDFMSDPQFKRLPRVVSAYSKAGWYQGSVFFLISALINYRWSRDPTALMDPIEKAIAGLTTALLLGSSAWYNKNGVRGTGAVVTIAGALQAWAAFFA